MLLWLLYFFFNSTFATLNIANVIAERKTIQSQINLNHQEFVLKLKSLRRRDDPIDVIRTIKNTVLCLFFEIIFPGKKKILKITTNIGDNVWISIQLDAEVILRE